MLSTLRHIQSRRADLSSHIDVRASFAEWEESCVPSYCHTNWLAAFISWQRLFRCVSLAKTNRPNPRRVLDFGSSVGELGHLLHEPDAVYEFIEQDAQAASYLRSRLPNARQVTLDDGAQQAYDWMFAIDSLEHNDNVDELLQKLGDKLAPDGILVLSGPTENALYKMGRKFAGFSGGYHKTNIYEIERKASRTLQRVDGERMFPACCFFSLSVWKRV